jgi:hypothetical protein
MLLYSSLSCPNAVAVLLTILTLSSLISLNSCAASIDLYLKRLEFWQLLGFHDGSLVNGEDWRLDVLLAFGKSVYTMKFGIGGQFYFPRLSEIEKHILFLEMNEFGEVKHIRIQIEKIQVREMTFHSKKGNTRNKVSRKRNNFTERQYKRRNFTETET